MRKCTKQEQEGEITRVNLLRYIYGKAREMKGVSEVPNPNDLAKTVNLTKIEFLQRGLHTG